MRVLRDHLARLLTLILLTGLLAALWPAPARAEVIGIVIDDFSGNTAGTRNTAGLGSTIASGSGVMTISVVNGNGNFGSLIYDFAQPIDLTRGGSADVLGVQLTEASTNNPDVSAAVALLGVEVIDDQGRTASLSTGFPSQGSPFAINFPLSGAGGLVGGADRTKIAKLSVIVWAASNVGGYFGTVTIDQIATLTYADVAEQRITFTSTAPNPVTIGQTYTVAATGGPSGKPIVFSVGPDTTNSACTVSGATVQFNNPGTCQIAADQDGDDLLYNAAPTAYQTIQVGKIPQQLMFTTVKAEPRVGDSYAPNVVGGGSSNAVTLSVGAGTTNGACVTDGTTFYFEHRGTCVVAANQAGDDTYAPATEATQTLIVAKGIQSITFDSVAPAQAGIGDHYDVVASGGGSSAPLVFSVGAATTNNACTVTGSRVDFIHAGTCQVAANQAGDDDHDAAPQATQLITVVRSTQGLIFTSAPPTPAYVGGTYDVTALGGDSGEPIVFSASGTACQMAGPATVLFESAGSCQVHADQAGNADFEAAARVTQEFTISTIPSEVAVDLAPSSPVYGQPATVTATVVPAVGDAEGAVQFSVDGSAVGAAVPLASGAASLSLPTDLAAGSHTVTAQFTPSDPNTYAPAEGNATVPVAKSATVATVSVLPTALRAMVTAAAPGAGTPTGTVRFLVDGVEVGTAALDGAGTAELPYALPAGSVAGVAAAYAGDANFLPSSGSTSRQDPSITATVTGKPEKSRSGWYRGTVTVRFTCAAGSAPLTAPCPAPVVLKRNGAGQSASATVAAADGGIATASISGINIDRAKPRVRIKGVTSRGTYDRAPQARCVAKDKLSGIKRCTIKQKKLKGDRIRYTAVAIDKAGNKSRRSVTVALSVRQVGILGLAAKNGVYDVRLGNSYTLVVVGGPRPRYVDAAVAPNPPAGLDAFFRHDGTVNGKPRWVINVTITANMGHTTLWNLGVLQGGKLHVVKVRVG